MLLVLLAAGAAQTIDPAAVPRRTEPARCQRGVVQAATTGPTRPRKLEDLPPGLLQLAVDKRVGGCSVTVLPTRDAQGNHRMLFRGEPAQLNRADGSRAQGRSKRQR